MKVSVCVIAYNEEKVLDTLINDIKAQDYPHEKIEVLMINSMSTDKTQEIMEHFRDSDDSFEQIRVLQNPRKIQAAGWNIAIDNYSGDAMIRIDAHAEIPSNFVSSCVSVLNTGEYVVGGPRPNIIDESTPWKELLLLAEQSMFGSSIAAYRNSDKKSYVNSLFHGCYRREVIDKVGHFNEQLGRTEDNEFHYRIRKAGYKICYTPEINSCQHTRSTLKGILKQKAGNGEWVALTLKACPECLSLYHFVPLGFVSGIILTTLLALAKKPFLGKLMWGMYWTVAVIMALFSVKGHKKHPQQLLLPGLFFLLHVSYGYGSLKGLCKLPFWKYDKDWEKKYKKIEQ